MALGQPQRGIDKIHTALRGIRRLGHPPRRWRAWWTLGTALAPTSQYFVAAAAVEAAANTLHTWRRAASQAPERGGRPLVARALARDPLGRRLQVGSP